MVLCLLFQLRHLVSSLLMIPHLHQASLNHISYNHTSVYVRPLFSLSNPVLPAEGPLQHPV